MMPHEEDITARQPVSSDLQLAVEKDYMGRASEVTAVLGEIADSSVTSRGLSWKSVFRCPESGVEIMEVMRTIRADSGKESNLSRVQILWEGKIVFEAHDNPGGSARGTSGASFSTVDTYVPGAWEQAFERVETRLQGKRAPPSDDEPLRSDRPHGRLRGRKGLSSGLGNWLVLAVIWILVIAFVICMMVVGLPGER